MLGRLRIRREHGRISSGLYTRLVLVYFSDTRPPTGRIGLPADSMVPDGS